MKKVLLFILLATGASAAERVALVIGNGSYEHSPRLANPVNDATDIASALKNCGFNVIGGGSGSDLSHELMDKKLQEFRAASANAKVALFFFAGHGLEVDGSNYLMPVDAKIENKFQVKHRALALDEVMESMAGEDRLKIVILDCCRNNPLARSWQRSGDSGLAVPRSTPGGTVLLYSTAPGKTAEDGIGRNSPFTGVLKETLQTPNLDISEVFRNVGSQVKKNTTNQEPWMNTSYYGSFSFNQTKSSVAQVSSHAATVTDLNQKSVILLKRADEYYYGSVKVSKNATEAAKLYLESANLGNAVAMRSIGYCYEAGVGVARNQGEAISWYQKGANISETGSLFNLALCYDHGKGVDKNEKKAADLYLKAATLGHVGSMNSLAYYYYALYENDGNKQNFAEAAKWLSKSSELGNADSMWRMGALYDTELNGNDDRVAAMWYEKSASLGHPSALRSLAICYRYGKGVAQSKQKAMELYRRAARAGNQRAKEYLEGLE